MTIAVYVLSFVIGWMLVYIIKLRRRLKRLQVRLDGSKQKYIDDTQDHWSGPPQLTGTLGEDPEEFYRNVIDSLPSRSDVYFQVTASYTDEQKSVETSYMPGELVGIAPGLYLTVNIIDFSTSNKLGTIPLGLLNWSHIENGSAKIKSLVNRVSDTVAEQERARQMDGRSETVVNINPYA